MHVRRVIARTQGRIVRSCSAVHVNLPPGYVRSRRFRGWSAEHAMRARVRHHQRGEIRRVRVRFSSEIGQIDIPSFNVANRQRL